MMAYLLKVDGTMFGTNEQMSDEMRQIIHRVKMHEKMILQLQKLRSGE